MDDQQMTCQAIETKYYGPTNYRGSRIRVRCQARTIFVSWDHALGVEDNHDAAAKTLAEKLAWCGTWFSGALTDGSGNVYVRAANDNAAFMVEV